eukprot:Opistho-2@38132
MYFSNARHRPQLGDDARPLALDDSNLFAQLRQRLECTEGGLRRQFAHVVRRLHLGHDVDYSGIGDCHSEANASKTESLGESLQNDELRVLINELAHALLVGKVNVCLVYNDNTFESLAVKQRLDVFESNCICRWIVWRTDKDYLGLIRGGRKNLLWSQLKLLSERNRDNLDIVDISGHFVHSVCRRHNDNVVVRGRAEDADKNVNRFVAADADKNHISVHPSKVGNFLLQLPLVRTRVAVQITAVRIDRPKAIFVGIEEDARIIVITRTSIRHQGPDVGPHDALKIKHRRHFSRNQCIEASKIHTEIGTDRARGRVPHVLCVDT